MVFRFLAGQEKRIEKLSFSVFGLRLESELSPQFLLSHSALAVSGLVRGSREVSRSRTVAELTERLSRHTVLVFVAWSGAHWVSLSRVAQETPRRLRASQRFRRGLPIVPIVFPSIFQNPSNQSEYIRIGKNTLECP